jgi:hypothetical protein
MEASTTSLLSRRRFLARLALMLGTAMGAGSLLPACGEQSKPSLTIMVDMPQRYLAAFQQRYPLLSVLERRVHCLMCCQSWVRSRLRRFCLAIVFASMHCISMYLMTFYPVLTRGVICHFPMPGFGNHQGNRCAGQSIIITQQQHSSPFFLMKTNAPQRVTPQPASSYGLHGADPGSAPFSPVTPGRVTLYGKLYLQR